MIQNEEGFTLVELIVVVAILGILAVIGITRFAGLTDDARLQSDYSLASAMAVASQAWIAAGDHSYQNNNIDIQDLKDDKYLIEDIGYKSQSNGNDFTIDYDYTTNSITVKAGTDQFYPIP